MNRKSLFESRLASGITAGATSFSVDSGEGQFAPESNFVLGIYPAKYPSPASAIKDGLHEWVVVGSRSSDTMSSVVRGQFGSSALDHNEAGKKYVVYNPLMAEELIGVNQIFKDIGGDDAYVIATGFGLTDLNRHDGTIFPLRVETANTGACGLTVDSVTSKSIKVVDGSGVRDPLSGEIPADGVVLLKWLEDDDYFLLLNPVAVVPVASFTLVLSGSPIQSGDVFTFPGLTTMSTMYIGTPGRKVRMRGMTLDSGVGQVELSVKETIVAIANNIDLQVKAIFADNKWRARLYAGAVEVANTETYEPDGDESEMVVMVDIY